MISLRRPRRLSGGDLVARALRDAGIDCVFSLPGSQTLPIADAIARRGELRLVTPRSERDGAYMAEGYGQAKGLPAVLMNTLGPGVANELPGVFSAQMSRTPVLCVSPYQPRRKRERIREVFQGLDHPLFFQGACKSIRVAEADEFDELPGRVETCMAECMAEPRGPVRLEIAFPALFRRRLRRARGTRRSRAAPAAAEVYAVCASADDVNEVWTEIGLAEGAGAGAVLRPGSGDEASLLSFALGAKLARPTKPVALAASPEQVLEQLGALAVARLHRVPVLLLADTGVRSTLAEVAALFETRLVRAPRPGEETARAVLCEKRALSVLVR